MNALIFDNQHALALRPLTFTRPQGAIRCGILTIKEKWEGHLNQTFGYLTQSHLQTKFKGDLGADNLLVSGSVLPNATLVEAVKQLALGEALVQGGECLAARVGLDAAKKVVQNNFDDCRRVEYAGVCKQVNKLFHLLPLIQDEIRSDFNLITKDRTSTPISETVTLVGAHKNPDLLQQVFIEEGAEVEYCYLNPQDGPIYIGKNAKVMEGAMLRGPIALGESSQISMGAKIYAGAAIGPWCKIGGEVSNSIVMGFSNKVHDGYLGDSILGEWCNLGADTNTSNLKNDYAKVKLWNYASGRFEKTELQFCGLVMGDYSRSGINTSFNSGTVVGVGSNIYGAGFPRNFVPSFVIGGPQGYKLNGLKAVEGVATTAKGRRRMDFTAEDKAILEHVFEESKPYRASLK